MPMRHCIGPELRFESDGAEGLQVSLIGENAGQVGQVRPGIDLKAGCIRVELQTRPVAPGQGRCV